MCDGRYVCMYQDKRLLALFARNVELLMSIHSMLVTSKSSSARKIFSQSIAILGFFFLIGPDFRLTLKSLATSLSHETYHHHTLQTIALKKRLCLFKIYSYADTHQNTSHLQFDVEH